MAYDNQDKEGRKSEIEAFHKRYSRTGLWRLRLRRHIRAITWFLMVTLVSSGKRLFDIVISLFFVILTFPLLIIGACLSGRSLHRRPRLGRWGVIYDELSFSVGSGLGGRVIKRLHLTRLPALFNILKGDMSFVGPLPASPGDLDLRDKAVRKRCNVRPGLISLWWIRRKANIDYGTELDIDMEYVDSQGIWSDIGICIRAIPAIIFGDGIPTPKDKIILLGITMDNITMTDAIDRILSWLNDTDPKQICFVNADCANIAYKNKTYLDVLKQADLCLADGIGLKLAGKLLGQHITQNVNGTDMFPKLCEALSNRSGRLFLLGARPEVVEGLVAWIGANHPKVIISGYQHGYFNKEEEPKIIERINDSGANLLLVALGSPRQDLWIDSHLEKLSIGVAIGVGGLFDFYSGRLPRAPYWMREIGLEWFYRFMQEPRRLWKRYLIGNVLFLGRVVKERVFQGNG